MTRVALYTRVSTDRQETENQRRQLRAFVDGHEGWKLVEEYRDEESGASGIRARFQALFEDAHQRKFEVVVWALDRFSREGTRATINYLHELESYGVGFVSYTERYLDSTGVFRDALIGLLAALANQEGIRLRAQNPDCLFGPSRERLRSRTLPPGDCSLSARSHQETERGLGLACVFVPLFLDPRLPRPSAGVRERTGQLPLPSGPRGPDRVEFAPSHASSSSRFRGANSGWH